MLYWCQRGALQQALVSKSRGVWRFTSAMAPYNDRTGYARFTLPFCFVLLKDYVTVSFYSVWIKKLYYCHIFRSSHRTCSVRKDALRNFAKFIGKHLCPSLFFNKVAGPATLLTKRPWHRCFPVNFAKFLRTPFIQSTSRRLLLYIALYLNLAKDRQTGSRQRDFEIEKDSWNLGNGYKIWVTWQQI